MLLDHLRGITKFVLPNSCYQGLKVLVANAVLTVSTNSWAKNVRYDRDTRLIMKNLLDTHSNAMDIGASVGDFTDELVRIIKHGKVFSFEPIPECYDTLEKKFGHIGNLQLFNLALSDEKSVKEFFIQSADLGYSGFQKTTASKDIHGDFYESIEVSSDTLDNLIPADLDIHFIKIDVEGAELLVLRGGINLIARCRPVIVFECGSHIESYGINAEDIFNTLDALGMKLFTTESFLSDKISYTSERFCLDVANSTEFYFVAAPD